ncbi:conserved hypothetical protein [Modestobacter sp. DSM 44400]|uniref:EthD family reductase n=1 Tax=Modestobacter sp. DSM 44400 TaxID=1550230 RepID=UPI00089AE04B|nr:EthD family reductase [Modestobacter sp. DSM 44400]SDX74820.1 conserved hypothetical protein [Modestobacter sp. DSM 44400]
MVHRLMVSYGQPTDPAAFDQHYRNVHAGLGKAIPGVLRFTIGHGAPLAPGQPAPYLVAELDFESAEAMAEAMASPAGAAAGSDVGTFATGGATMVSFDVEEVSPAG